MLGRIAVEAVVFLLSLIVFTCLIIAYGILAFFTCFVAMLLDFWDKLVSYIKKVQ